MSSPGSSQLALAVTMAFEGKGWEAARARWRRRKSPSMNGTHPVLVVLRAAQGALQQLPHAQIDAVLAQAIPMLIEDFPDAWRAWRCTEYPSSELQAEPYLCGADRNMVRSSVSQWSPLARLVGLQLGQCVAAASRHMVVNDDAWERVLPLLSSMPDPLAQATLNALQPATAPSAIRQRLWTKALVHAWEHGDHLLSSQSWLEAHVPLLVEDCERVADDIFEHLQTCFSAVEPVWAAAGRWLNAHPAWTTALAQRGARDPAQQQSTPAWGKKGLDYHMAFSQFRAAWPDAERTRQLWNATPEVWRESFALAVWSHQPWDADRQRVLAQGLAEGWLPVRDGLGESFVLSIFEQEDAKALPVVEVLRQLNCPEHWAAQEVWTKANARVMARLVEAGATLDEETWWTRVRGVGLSGQTKDGIRAAWGTFCPAKAPSGRDEHGVLWEAYRHLHTDPVGMDATLATEVWKAALLTGQTTMLDALAQHHPHAALTAHQLPGSTLASLVVRQWVQHADTAQVVQFDSSGRWLDSWVEHLVATPGSWGDDPGQVAQAALACLMEERKPEWEALARGRLNNWKGPLPLKSAPKAMQTWWGQGIATWQEQDFNPAWDTWWARLIVLDPVHAQAALHTDQWPANVVARIIAGATQGLRVHVMHDSTDSNKHLRYLSDLARGFVGNPGLWHEATTIETFFQALAPRCSDEEEDAHMLIPQASWWTQGVLNAILPTAEPARTRRARL